ncbi:glycosyltransferase family 9 protein [Cellulomonas fimi]|uniref:glycosyltransferase family 9 protein n=1 Tax=Cellulomonas fimi TaxID=1708 RepID=UPI00234D284D|nr:glycosyltransferase family 9 protein [Cellulomonas fimi]MDC7122755.1 glycosyltransferase family 9 protein [Cellulomonas fimi]
MTTTLVVRLDSDGDVLLAGPAVRALAVAGPLDLLVSPAGAAAAHLLPDVRAVHVFDAPWSGYVPPPTDRAAVEALLATVGAARYDRAVVLTSWHQSPLPAALLLRLAGVPVVAATSDDYPGSLLDVRHRRRPGRHEVDASLDLVEACGVPRPADDRLAVRSPLPDASALVPDEPYVVVHPGASVPARALASGHAAAVVEALADRGAVVVTGSPGERPLTAAVAGGRATDLGGRTDLPLLAAVLAGADTVVVGNTGPAHLAAAVGAPVVSLFAPVVPAERWRPWGVPHVLLGDQRAACAGTSARRCPVAGHPCLSDVAPGAVVAAVDALREARVVSA